MEIKREESPGRGRYLMQADDTGEVVAELTFSRRDESTVIADHTGVPKQHRGQGLGLKLVERLVSDARKESFTIVPQCSFVRAMAEKHPQWSDVIQGS